jgi:hypothetical protein
MASVLQSPFRRGAMSLPWTTLVVTLALLLLASSKSSAQSPAKSPDAEAFTACREQEKVGDARACWTVWLSRFRTVGSEAEVAYAEEHAAHAPAAPASPPPAAPPAAAPAPATPPTATPPPPAVPLPTPPVAMVDSATGDIIDFCAAPTNPGSSKQKLIVLAPAGADSIALDPQIVAVEGGRLFREVFTARLALPHFDNVVTSIPSNPGWEVAPSLTLQEIQSFLVQARQERDPARQARVERERDFVLYSLPCADYLALPTLTSRAVTHQAAAPANAAAASPLALQVTGALGIFKRDGDVFHRVATLSASAPSATDLASDTAILRLEAPPEPKMGGVDLASGEHTPLILPSHLSAVPDARCLLGKAGRKGVSGLQSCSPKGEGTADQASDGDERRAPVCRQASRSGEASALVRCEVSARAFQLARALGREAMTLDAFRLYGPMTIGELGPSIALGDAEGVKTGLAFEAHDGKGGRAGYYKVTRVGAGGETGKTAPTIMNVRFGDAPSGTWVTARPQLGLSVTPYVSVGGLALQAGSTEYEMGKQVLTRALATTVAGGGVMIGYDLSSALHWSETFVRLGGGVLAPVAGAQDTSLFIVPIDLWLEKGFYIARRLTLITAIGASYEHVSLSLDELPPLFTQEVDFSGNLFGPAARLGLSVMLHPNVSVGVEALARIPVNTVSYGAAAFGTVPAMYQEAVTQWGQRSDHFATIVGNVGLTLSF